MAGRPLQVQIDVRDAKNRPLTQISPNHGKPMQAVVVRDPEASYLLHVHPEVAGPGAFRFTFTPPEAGTSISTPSSPPAGLKPSATVRRRYVPGVTPTSS